MMKIMMMMTVFGKIIFMWYIIVP